MSAINDVSNTYIAELTARSPMMATYLGLPGGEDRLDDLSPDGLAEGNRLVTRTLAALVAAESAGVKDDVARSVLAERLEVEHDLYDSGWAHATLNVIASPLQEVRLVFDLMPNESDDDVAVLTRRMAAVPKTGSGRTGRSARPARLPWPMSRRLGPRMGLFSPVLYGGKL